MKYIFRGDILKQLREKMGVKQYELARQTNLTKDTISNLERGIDSDPHLSTMVRLANYFDVSIDLFCDRHKYYYADKTITKFIEYMNRGIFERDVLEQAFDIYANQDSDLNKKRVAILRKIHLGDKTFIDSMYYLICE